MTYVHVQKDSKKKQMPLNEGSSAIARGLMCVFKGGRAWGWGRNFVLITQNWL